MDNSRFAFFTLKTLLLIFPLAMLFSCQEWTPQADGYFVVSGKRYNVHIMAIYGAAFPERSANNIQVILQGAPSFNIVMFVTSPGNTLAEGDYHMSYSYELRRINSLSVRYGSNAEFGANQDTSSTSPG